MVGPTLPHWTCSSAWELEDVESSEELLLEVEGAAVALPLEVAVPCMSRPVLFRFPMTPVLQSIRWQLWACDELHSRKVYSFGQRFNPTLSGL